MYTKTLCSKIYRELHLNSSQRYIEMKKHSHLSKQNKAYCEKNRINQRCRN